MGRYRFTVTASDCYSCEELNGDDLAGIENDLEQLAEDYGLDKIKVKVEDSECIRKNDSKKGIITDAGKIEETVSYLIDPGSNGCDADEVLSEYVHEVLNKTGTIFSWDELTIHDGEKDVVLLEEFCKDLRDKIINGVCNVLETA